MSGGRLYANFHSRAAKAFPSKGKDPSATPGGHLNGLGASVGILHAEVTDATY